MWSPQLRFRFDCEGFVRLRAVFDPSQVRALIDPLCQAYPRGVPHRFPILNLGRPFWDVMSNDRIRDVCTTYCRPEYRLDHALGLSSNGAVPNLHGGNLSSQGTCFIAQRGEETLVSQLTIGVVLKHQKNDGFCYVPGSHKSSMPLDGHQVLQMFGGKFSDAGAVVPHLDPGDVIVLSESLVHGDCGWNNPDQNRLTLYYKFAPGFIAWRDPVQQLEKYAEFASTDFERRLVRGPWSGRFEDTFGEALSLKNERRKPT